MKLYDLRLRQKLGFSYSNDISEMEVPVGNFISYYLPDILYKVPNELNLSLDKYGFIDNFKDSDRLLFYSKYTDKVPSNINFDENCYKVGSHIKCITDNGDIAFDITEDREKNKDRTDINNIIEVDGEKYMRFAIRKTPNRAIIQFLASLDISDINKTMSYDEFINYIS